MHNVYVRSNKLFALFKRLDGFGQAGANIISLVIHPRPYADAWIYSSKKLIHKVNFWINNAWVQIQCEFDILTHLYFKKLLQILTRDSETISLPYFMLHTGNKVWTSVLWSDVGSFVAICATREIYSTLGYPTALKSRLSRVCRSLNYEHVRSERCSEPLTGNSVAQ